MIVVKNVKDNQIKYKIMKKTSTNKPAFIVDLTNINTCEDIQFEFIRGKVRSGISITEQELYNLINYGSHLTLEMIDSALDKYCEIAKPFVITDNKLVEKISKLVIKEITPKKPWYKRMFGWIKNPFKKK